MSIDKKGPNRFRFRVQHQGQQYSRIFHGTEREAKKEHEKFKYEVKNDQINNKGDIKFHEYAQMFYDEYVKNLRYGTQQIYLNSFNKHLNPVLGMYKLKNITPYQIQQLVNNLKKEHSANTVRNIYANLSRAFHFAVKWQFVEKSPCAFITLPAVTQTNMDELYSIDDIKKLITIYEEETNLLHKAAFFLALGCGLRNSEIRALTRNDIDFKNNTVTVNKQIGMVKGKNGKVMNEPVSPKTDSSVRTIHMPSFVVDALKEHMNAMEFIPISKCIFYSHVTKREISSHCLSKRFTTKIKDNNLPELRFHDLRHLHATLLIHSGANLQATAKRMGHSSIKTTISTYIHSMHDIDKTTSDLINEKYSDLSHKKQKLSQSCPID